VQVPRATAVVAGHGPQQPGFRRGPHDVHGQDGGGDPRSRRQRGVGPEDAIGEHRDESRPRQTGARDQPLVEA
jgi:hypothetical protein